MKRIFLFLVFLIFTSSLYAQATYIKKELNTSGASDTSSTDEQSNPPEIRKYNIISPNTPDSDTDEQNRPPEIRNNILPSVAPDQGQNQREAQLLRQEVLNLKAELSAQKDLTSMLVDRANDISNNQSQINSQLQNTISTLKDINSDTDFLKQQLLFRDSFIFNKTGKPFAFIDPSLRIYEYSSGNLIGSIDINTNEIIRNYDGSTIATLEKNFLIDQNGQPIGSIERSETLRLEREKLYPQIQKNPISHFFVPIEGKKQFIQTPSRFSDWSTQMLEDVLFFSEKKIQKLK